LFLRILNRPDGFRTPGQPEDFVRGFQVFDKDGTGFIGVGELKYGEASLGHNWRRIVLTSLGEKLNDDEVDELLKGVNVGKDGSINYTGIARAALTDTLPEFVQMILANWSILLLIDL
jgi:calmodulin